MSIDDIIEDIDRIATDLSDDGEAEYARKVWALVRPIRALDRDPADERLLQAAKEMCRRSQGFVGDDARDRLIAAVAECEAATAGTTGTDSHDRT